MELSRTRAGGICANCGQVRPLESLLAFWPIGEPGRRQFVCRPLDPAGGFMSCFRDAVSTIDEHEIRLATDIERPVIA